MNRLQAFIGGLGVSVICYIVWDLCDINRRWDANVTTFVLYWYFLYRLFHDKNKDA
jgi:hypothetical protein